MTEDDKDKEGDDVPVLGPYSHTGRWSERVSE